MDGCTAEEKTFAAGAEIERQWYGMVALLVAAFMTGDWEGN